MDPVTLVLIGAPTVAGAIIRMRYWNWNYIRLSLRVSHLIFASMAVGYLFSMQERSSDFFIKHSFISIVTGLVSVTFSVGVMFDFKRKFNDFTGCLILYGIMSLTILVFVISNSPSGPALAPFSAVFTFVSIATFLVVLGPAATGFAVSAATYSFVLTGDFHVMPIYQSLFQAIGISEASIKILFVISTAVVASIEGIVTSIQKVLDC